MVQAPCTFYVQMMVVLVQNITASTSIADITVIDHYQFQMPACLCVPEI